MPATETARPFVAGMVCFPRTDGVGTSIRRAERQARSARGRRLAHPCAAATRVAEIAPGDFGIHMSARGPGLPLAAPSACGFCYVCRFGRDRSLRWQCGRENATVQTAADSAPPASACSRCAKSPNSPPVCTNTMSFSSRKRPCRIWSSMPWKALPV